MQLNSYDDMTVEVLDRTPITQELIQFACDICMKKADDISGESIKPLLARSLITAEHTSVFEHSSMSILVKGVSRSFLAQVTRHRHFSFTSASQHYQDYSEYPFTMHPYWHPDGNDIGREFQDAYQYCLDRYLVLLNLGVPPEEARQVLPNGCTVNIIITGNVRTYLEFLKLRLCERNVQEMQTFAQKVYKLCMTWCPEVFANAGPPCKIFGKCNQGRMSCKTG